MTHVFNIVDAASGIVVSQQVWADDNQAPALWSGQIAVLVNVGINNVSGSFSATGAGASRCMIGDFNVSVSGTFAAAVVLEKSFDGGTTWVQAAFSDGTLVQFTAPTSGTWSETEPGVAYRLRCNSYTSGTVAWRISQ